MFGAACREKCSAKRTSLGADGHSRRVDHWMSHSLDRLEFVKQKDTVLYDDPTRLRLSMEQRLRYCIQDSGHQRCSETDHMSSSAESRFPRKTKDWPERIADNRATETGIALLEIYWLNTVQLGLAHSLGTWEPFRMRRCGDRSQRIHGENPGPEILYS